VSSRGQLVLALGLLVLLGVWGLWLINVPLWAAATVGAGAVLGLGWLVRRIGRKHLDREKTEA
jgi:hypothetical protein